MALGLAAKKEIVAEINDVASRALSVAVAEYRGMEVAELTDLRVKAREQGVYLRVVRNTLAKRALSMHQAVQRVCLKTTRKVMTSLRLQLFH